MWEKVFAYLFTLTPPWMKVLFRRLKYYVLGKLPPSTYWNFAASISPTAAICTDCVEEERFFELGRTEADLMRELGLLLPCVRVLDIGCGIGRVERAIHSEVNSVTGLDVSSRMVALARQKVAAPNVAFVVSDGRSLAGVGTGQFDLVFSFLVFQHMPRSAVAAYFADVRRVLSAGGRFFFQIPISRDPTSHEPPAHHPFAVRYYSPPMVKDLLRQAGLVLLGRFDVHGSAVAVDQADTTMDHYFLAATS